MDTTSAITMAIAELRQAGAPISLESIRTATAKHRGGRPVSTRQMLRPINRALVDAARPARPRHPLVSGSSRSVNSTLTAKLAKALEEIQELKRVNASLLAAERARRNQS